MNTKTEETTLYAHKYSIQLDIFPEITYLNHERTAIIADLLPHFHDFPSEVWISHQSVDEGLDFCRVIFWVFSESSESLKLFGIWFQALFRDTQLSKILEKLVYFALDDPVGIEVELSDWTRILTSDVDIDRAVQMETAEKYR